MEQDDIFKAVQKALRSPPMLLIGCGYSASHHLPGMKALAAHLIDKLDPRYSTDLVWCTFRTNLDAGLDLESALAGLTLGQDLLKDIRIQTWELVTAADLDFYNRILFLHEEVPLADLLKYFYQSHPQKVDIITTNYDRVIEYACDVAHIPVNTGFCGYYTKRYDAVFPTKNTVNLIKVHGSLDVYQDPHGAVISLPPQSQLPHHLLPEIITPGLSKFEAILTGTPRQLLYKADEIIREAKNFLCIGYGFNDIQIQENIIQKTRAGTPITLVTKEISDTTAHLLANNAPNAITICEGDAPDTTRFCINQAYYELPGTYWTVKGLMDIISN